MSVLTERDGTERDGTERGGAERDTDAEALRIFLRLIRPRPVVDPYPSYARLRDLAPFLPIRFPGVPNGYLVSTYTGCSRLLRDPAFGPPTREHLDALKPDWRDNAFTRCLYRSMVFRSGRSHRERRQIASHHFAPRQIGAYRSELERIATMLIDDLADRARAAGNAPIDLMENLALPFASLSLGRLLGIADEDAVVLGRLARQAGGVFEQFATARQHQTIAAAGEELVERLTAIVADRRGHAATNDLLSALADSETGADDQELVGAAVLLFGAGFDSPASMVGLGTKLLLDHPDQAALLRASASASASANANAGAGTGTGAARTGAARTGTADTGTSGTAGRAVAEILRYEPPVQLVARAALKSAELEGWPVPQGSMVFGLIAAGNRDPAQVKEPETFDIIREHVPSLSFGAGPHYCLGAYLAGMQGEVIFPRLLRRFPAMRVATDPVYREPGSTLRGIDRLELILTP
jgi:cytochrome P450